MIKKFVKGIIAAMTVMSVSMTAMAAGSIVGSIDMPKVSSSAGSVSLVNVTAGMYDEQLQAVVDALNRAGRDVSVAEAFGTDLPVVNLYNAEGLKQENINLGEYKFLSPVMDLQIKDAVPSAENPVTVTFVANNMTDNIEVSVLHFCEEHNWELLETEKVSSNQVSADFHSASPVALIYKEKNEGNVGSDVKSPQTGERPVLPAAAGAAAFAGLGFFAVKKSRKNA